MLLQSRVREAQEGREPQLKSQDTSHQTGPCLRAGPCVQGLHYGLWHKQLELRTSPVLAPGQLKHRRTCSLDMEQRDVPRRPLRSSLQTALWPPPSHRAGLPTCPGDYQPTRRSRSCAHLPTLTAAMTGEAMTDKVTPPVMAKFLLCLEVFFPSYLLWI